jgi:uncharacterized membrane protein YeaQ/YmgE (transglycosylase-associated protein family)
MPASPIDQEPKEQNTPTPDRRCGHLLSIVAGIISAIVLHYVLYRIGLPSEPFIYVAF